MGLFGWGSSVGCGWLMAVGGMGSYGGVEQLGDGDDASGKEGLGFSKSQSIG